MNWEFQCLSIEHGKLTLSQSSHPMAWQTHKHTHTHRHTEWQIKIMEKRRETKATYIKLKLLSKAKFNRNVENSHCDCFKIIFFLPCRRTETHILGKNKRNE